MYAYFLSGQQRSASSTDCSGPATPCRSTSPVTETSSSSYSTSPSPPSTNSSSSTVDLDSWPENFQIPWTQMPNDLKIAVLREKRPVPRDRREMIRLIVDQMRAVEANPTRADCICIAKKIIQKHPKSFADVLQDGSKIGSGYSSLVNQLKTRVEHLNRDSMKSPRRAGKQPTTSTSSSTTKRPSDQYGCVQWQPACPTGQSEESLREKQKELLELHSREGPMGAERGVVQQLMKETYYLQRQAINAHPPPTIAQLKGDWPYLFVQKQLYLHFNELTDIPILEKLEAAIQEKGKMILQFFRQKPSNSDVRQVLSRFDGSGSTGLAPCVVLCLLAHFKEEREALLLQVEVSFFFSYMLIFVSGFYVFQSTGKCKKKVKTLKF